MLLSLFSFGFSFNLSFCNEEKYNISNLESKFFTNIYPNEIPSGIVKELLTNCKNTQDYLEKCKKTDEVNYNEPQINGINFISPIIFSTLAYLIVVCIVYLNKSVVIPHEENETIPIKIYCLKSFLLPEVEILPQFFDIPQQEIIKSWDSIINDPIEDSFQIPPNTMLKNDIQQHEPETELFDAVNVKSSDITLKPMKSLFSYDNWY